MFYRILILVLAFVCVAPFFIEDPDGRPLLTFDQLIHEARLDLDNLKDMLPSTLPLWPTGSSDEGQATAKPVTIYKWQDQEGDWQFSTTPPPDAVNMQAVELGGSVTSLQRSIPVSEGGSTQTLPAGLRDIAPEQLEALMKQINDLRQTTDPEKEN